MLKEFKCPTCSAPLNYKGGPDLTINCSFCGTPVIVPPELRTGPIVEPPTPTSAAPLTVSQRPEFVEVERLARAGNKIEAIKLFRQLTGAGLKESKDVIDKLAQGDTRTAANYAATADQFEIASDTADRAGQIEKIGRLLKAGNKIEAIKVYRQTFGVGLKEAKDAVERLQTTVGTPGAFELHPTTVSSSSRQPLRPPPSIARLKDQSAKLKQIGDNVRAGNKAGAARVLSEVFDLGEAQSGDLVDMLADGKPVKIGNVTMEVAKEALESPVVEPARPRVGGCLAALALVIVAAIAAWFALSANGGDNQIMRAFRNLSPTETAVPTIAPQPTEAPAPTQAPPATPTPTATPDVLNATQILLGGFGTGRGLFENARSLAVDGAVIQQPPGHRRAKRALRSTTTASTGDCGCRASGGGSTPTKHSSILSSVWCRANIPGTRTGTGSHFRFRALAQREIPRPVPPPERPPRGQPPRSPPSARSVEACYHA